MVVQRAGSHRSRSPPAVIRTNSSWGRCCGPGPPVVIQPEISVPQLCSRGRGPRMVVQRTCSRPSRSRSPHIRSRSPHIRGRSYRSRSPSRSSSRRPHRPGRSPTLIRTRPAEPLWSAQIVLSSRSRSRSPTYIEESQERWHAYRRSPSRSPSPIPIIIPPPRGMSPIVVRPPEDPMR